MTGSSSMDSDKPAQEEIPVSSWDSVEIQDIGEVAPFWPYLPPISIAPPREHDIVGYMIGGAQGVVGTECSRVRSTYVTNLLYAHVEDGKCIRLPPLLVPLSLGLSTKPTGSQTLWWSAWVQNPLSLFSERRESMVMFSFFKAMEDKRSRAHFL